MASTSTRNNISRSWLVDAQTAARSLLGCVLVRETCRGIIRARIVETEAYLPDDPASHSFAGQSARNRSMFGRAGLAYVYRIHRSVCLNVVTGITGRGEAVLIRAAEPLEGLELARRLRAAASPARVAPEGVALMNGPGKLCQALEVTLELDGIDLLARDRLWLERGARRAGVRVEVSARIGITRASDLPLRFYEAGNPWVSRQRSVTSSSAVEG
ncbi:MAG TPA: DNA-3-methyladenine glycosylase [Candidatus Limnocylindrales bacterium]|nr:DNA-3-methyladenine glycosylase [Candidatus Limnocylindrales bacterium]